MKKLRKNGTTGWVLVASLVLPVICAGLLIRSFWDPFGQTAKLPVAVVNLDQPVSYQGKRLAVGENVVSQLKQNHELGWHFLSASEAATGMKQNRYYTVVTIPKNFSQHAKTVTDAQPQPMKLSYATNDSLNYIGGIISQTGATQLNQAVRQAVTKAYALSMFQQIKRSGQGFQRAATGATQLKNGTVTLSDGLNAYTTGVHNLNKGMLQLSTKVQSLPVGVQRLTTGAGQLTTGLDQLHAKTQPLANGVSQLDAGARRLATGATKVSDGAEQLTTKTGPLAPGVERLTAGARRVNNGMQQLETKVKPLAPGISRLDNGSQQVTTGLQQLNAKSGALASGVVQLRDGSQLLAMSTVKYANGVYQLNTGLQELNTKSQTLTQAIDQLAAGSDELAKNVQGGQAGITDLSKGVQALASGSTAGQQKFIAVTANASALLTQDLAALEQATISDGTPSSDSLQAVQNNVDQLQRQVGSADSVETDNATSQAAAKLTQAVANLDDSHVSGAGLSQSQIDAKVTAVATKTKMSAEQQAAMKSALANAGTSQSSTDATAKQAVTVAAQRLVAASDQRATAPAAMTQRTVAKLQNKLAALDDSSTNSSSASIALKKLKADVQTIQGGFSELGQALALQSAALSGLNTKVNVSDQSLVSQYAALISGSQKLAGGLDQVKQKTPGLTAGIGQLAQGSRQLADKSPALTEGASKLAAGTDEMAQGMPTLTSGVGKLLNGSQQLTTGLQQMNGQMPAFQGGITSLANGSLQVADGLTTLNAQLPALTNGLQRLGAGTGSVTNGAGQLQGGLERLNGQVPLLVAGVSQLTTGGHQLSNGLTTLNGQTPALVQGISQLTIGSQRLNQNSDKLVAGAKKVSDGNGTLAQSLQGGADKISAQPLTSRMAEMFAAPSDLDHQRFSYVPNFGHAIAPFVVAMMTFLGLTVLVAFFDIHQWLRTPRQLLNLTGWVILQGLLTSGGLGVLLHAVHPLAFMGWTTLFAVTVLGVELALRAYLGRLAVLVVGGLFFLQLCVANGIFPSQTVKTLYAPLAKFLPVTYANLGLSQALSGTGISSTVLTVGLSAACVILVLSVVAISLRFIRQFDVQQSETLDE
ncbi:YhgE/Pip family protein [Levilactobacillus tongjiangensis]|uniref:YhgE/Pip family protein n=1 Tax=Levilactobacillus tongjiangensis TaxID=2486023 RepID=A0ABW1STB2_9LACO|nr:YhgE/Pip family protein [Levilactobacillus tongjiangensis]